jgi:tRNA (adenine57-N1/adenine58-N1)-methyltransferase catalytic subunit
MTGPEPAPDDQVGAGELVAEGPVTGGFEYGDKAVVLDGKGRRYLTTLKEGGEFHTHNGFFPHAELIGRPEGIVVKVNHGTPYTVLRPTLEDFVVEMPRGAQVIYPKDLGAILLLADIGPGVRVLESGVGSGALSMTMLRAGATIVGYELREDFANRARGNVRSFLGVAALERYQVELRDCYAGFDVHDVDRVVLDLPEPWRVVPDAEVALRPGGIFLAYTPSIMQVSHLREALARSSAWIAPRTLEVLHRTWHVDGQAVRPDHRMVAHTGFLTVARYLGR